MGLQRCLWLLPCSQKNPGHPLTVMVQNVQDFLMEHMGFEPTAF